MRILMTADTVGGVWTYAMELCEALAPRGVEVILAAMGAPASSEQRRRAASLPNARLCEAPYKLEWMQDPWDDVDRAGDWLLSLERSRSPDVIHLNTYPHGALDFRAPILLVCHSCVRSWWRAVHGQPPPTEWETYGRRVRRGIAAADLVIAPTRSMLDEAIALYGVTGPTRRIPNGVDLSAYRSAEPEDFVLSMGRFWDEAKNLAAVDAASRGLDWPVYVAGSTQHPDGGSIMPGNATSLGLLPRDDVLDWLSRASIYVHPARYEPFGLSVLEAALSGCALVLGDIPSLRELWDGAARFVSPDDAGALHHELRGLIRNAGRRRDLAARARRRGGALDSSTMAAAYARAYEELASGAVHTPHAPRPSRGRDTNQRRDP
jgi:glycogen synthase